MTPSTPRTYPLSELKASAGVSSRTIRYYIRRGLLPPVEFRSSKTVYTEEHYARLLAIRKLREHHPHLDDVRDVLRQATPEQIAQWAGLLPPPPPLDVAAISAAPSATASVSPEPMDLEPAPQATMTTTVPAIEDGLSDAERWSRIALLPGLELHVRADASPLVLRLAGEIQARYSFMGSPIRHEE